MMPREKL